LIACSFIVADAGHFPSDIVDEVVSILGNDFAVTSAKLYQFSGIVPATIVLAFTKKILIDIPSAVLGAILVEPLMKLVRGSEDQSVFRFEVADGDRKVKTILRTKDEVALRRAIETLGEVVESPVESEAVLFDPLENGWKQLGRSSMPDEDQGSSEATGSSI
jgi:hypothetical protein